MESNAVSDVERIAVGFGPFTFDQDTGELRRCGNIVDLAPQPTRVLGMLLARPGRLVTREELRRHLWPDTIVEFDHGLNTCIRAVRAALGEDAGEPTYVQTVPRRGYRFIAQVEVLEPASSSAALEADRAVQDVVSPRGRPRWQVRLFAALLAGAGVGLATAAVLQLGRPAPRLAILGFENLSPELVPDVALQGLAEELALSLASNDPTDLVVITRGSAEAVRDRALPEAAHALRASHTLTGTVRSTQDRVVITASLGQVSDQSVLWADRYAVDQESFARQLDHVAVAIGTTLARHLGAVPPQPAAAVDPAVRAAVLRARYLLAQGRAADAVAHIETAVPDPGRVAGVQAILARARLELGDTIAARLAVERALALDPAGGEGHFAKAELAARSWWDWATARRAYEEAVRLEPGRAEFRHSYAYLLSILGEHRAAIREIALTLELDPVSPLVNGDVAWLHYFARDVEGAIRQAQVTLELVPDYVPALYCLMLALESDGQGERARQTALRIAGLHAASASALARIRSGESAPALLAFWQWFVETARADRIDSTAAYALAYGHALAGATDSAFLHLERAVRDRLPFVTSIGVDPRFDALREDPRFSGYLAKLGLSPASGAR